MTEQSTAPAAAPIQDKAPKPPGLMPKNIQAWVMLGLAVLMVVIMWLTGGKKAQTDSEIERSNLPAASTSCERGADQRASEPDSGTPAGAAIRNLAAEQILRLAPVWHGHVRARSGIQPGSRTRTARSRSGRKETASLHIALRLERGLELSEGIRPAGATRTERSRLPTKHPACRIPTQQPDMNQLAQILGQIPPPPQAAIPAAAPPAPESPTRSSGAGKGRQRSEGRGKSRTRSTLRPAKPTSYLRARSSKLCSSTVSAETSTARSNASLRTTSIRMTANTFSSLRARRFSGKQSEWKRSAKRALPSRSTGSSCRTGIPSVWINSKA